MKPALLFNIERVFYASLIPETLPLADRRCAVGQDGLLHRHAADLREHRLDGAVCPLRGPDDLLDALTCLTRQTEPVEKRSSSGNEQKGDEPVPELDHLRLPSSHEVDQTCQLILGIELDLDLVLAAHLLNANLSL